MELYSQPSSHDPSYAELLDITVKAVFYSVESIMRQTEYDTTPNTEPIGNVINKGIALVKNGADWQISIRQPLNKTLFKNIKQLESNINDVLKLQGIVEYEIKISSPIDTEAEQIPTFYNIILEVKHTGITEESLQAT